jgi:hypothetical protein
LEPCRCGPDMYRDARDFSGWFAICVPSGLAHCLHTVQLSSELYYVRELYTRVCICTGGTGQGRIPSVHNDGHSSNTRMSQNDPACYNLVSKKNMIFAQVINITPFNVSFRRTLDGVNRDKWTCFSEQCYFDEP